MTALFNPANLVVILVLAVITILIVRYLIKERKAGHKSCTGCCAGCAGCSLHRINQDKQVRQND